MTFAATLPTGLAARRQGNRFVRAFVNSQLAPLLGLVWIFFASPAHAAETEIAEHLTSEQIVRQALTATLFYEYEKWFALLRKRIAELESAPPTLATRADLMKLCFYLAGLNTELSHTLAFTRRYKVAAIEQEFYANISKAKTYAAEVAEDASASALLRAEAYLYLGAAEGYLGIFEYGTGNLIAALVNGLRSDNHLEQAIALNPALEEAYLGLGIYRYGNSRLGGIGNAILQGGRDLRLEGLLHLERAVRSGVLGRPLAMKTLIWFYIAEQINPQNAGLAPDHPLSAATVRKRAHDMIRELEETYFARVPVADFPGNKDMALMKAVQFVLDEDYASAREQFATVIRVSHYLQRRKGYAMNPKLIDTAEAGVRFSELMARQMQPPTAKEGTVSLCGKINRELTFLENGGSFVEYDAKKIRREIQDVFYNHLKQLMRKMNCSA